MIKNMTWGESSKIWEFCIVQHLNDPMMELQIRIFIIKTRLCLFVCVGVCLFVCTVCIKVLGE